MSEDLVEIRQGVSDLKTALALHDQKVDDKVARIVETQDRVATAVERIGDATIAIKALAEQWEKRNGAGLSLDKKMLPVVAAVLGLAAAAAGGGAEVVGRLIDMFLK